MYMKHQRTFYLKRVSKENAKAKTKSPPVVDDAASTASIESHVCSDRILTCRIKSICSPAKVGTGCYRF